MPEGDGGSGGNVEAVHTMFHGDDHFVVAGVDGAAVEAVALGAHDDDEVLFGVELGMVDRHCVRREGEGGGLVTEGVEQLYGRVGP